MEKRQNLFIALAIFAVSAAIYSRAAWFPFSVIDDSDYVSKNIHVTAGLSLESLKWALTAFYAGNWHPLTWMSLMLDGQFFGDDPMGYHLVNVALHALNASLLFLLFRSLTGALWRSAFVAACFAVHPLHVESVAWVAERKDVLSSMFFILTLVFYSGYVKQSKIKYYILALAAFSFGLMAKAMLVTIPVILIVVDIWPFQRFKYPDVSKQPGGVVEPFSGNGRVKPLRILLEKVPFGLLSLASSVVTLYAQKQNLSNLAGLPLSIRVANALWSTVLYLEKMLLPLNLAVFYPLYPVPFWKALCGAALLGGILCWAIYQRQSRPYLLTGWLWYLITLLPVIGLVQVGRQSMADRYTYIPLIGLFTVASWGGADLFRHFKASKMVIWFATSAVLVALTIGTWIQLGYWRDNLSLLAHTLDVTEDNAFAHDCLGLVYDIQGEPQLATAEYRKSLEIEPDNASAHYDLAFILDAQNNLSEAVVQYEDAIKLNPRFAEAHFSLGLLKGKMGELSTSERELAEAIRIEPKIPKYHNNLGALYARHGMLDAAVEQFSQALQLDPNDHKANQNLQTALQQKGLHSGQNLERWP